MPPLTPERLDIVHVATAQDAIDFLFGGPPSVGAAQDFQLHIDNGPFLALIRPEPHIRDVLEYLRPAYPTRHCHQPG